ncbi:alpha/beta hydrolase [Lentzea nigeriaca]|uniref:alpha/beta hydrolase n=1 Tax=Lentzea nigeriaca TaxID=1128665 RepID=UPI00195639C0|nr:alpha/beta hydrolase [Lentzea nigeriaca]MBM7861552.1 pimeloyl-ACP methyl ester carboxylesterase [Lentzea nigeriaca]
MTKRRSRVTAALFALIVLLGTSTSYAHIDGSPVAARKGLARFYEQALSWGACQSFATDAKSKGLFEREGIQCARLQVPLDYERPDMGTITVGLLRRPATEQGRRVGSLVVNPGGPGGSGMAHVANMQPNNPVGKRFDVVGFDPRGVGASQPRVQCLTDAERDAQRLRPKGDTANAVETENRYFVEKCAERSGIDLLRNVGTRDVVRDVDVLRAALGDKKLSYLGYSYGTRIGTLYAEMYPRNVRAMVLDGAVAVEGDKVDAAARQAQGFEQAFQRFAGWCAQRDCPIGTDKNAAESRFRQMIEPLKKAPLQVGERKLSHSDANTAIIQAMYSDRLWETALKGLQELKQNKGNTLLQLADQYLGRAPDGTYSRIQDAFVAIRCVDEPPVKDRATLESNRRRLLEILGNDTIPTDETALGPCAFWPAPHTSEPHPPNVTGLPQVLVVSTTGDPATPYQSGVDLATALGARLLTYNGNQHTAFLAGIGCVDGVGTNYLVDLRLPETDPVC